MIKVTGKIFDPNGESTLEFASVGYFMEDFVNDDIVEQELNELYMDIEIPRIGNIPAGKAIRTFADDWQWAAICDEFANNWTELIEDELATSGEYEFYGLKFIDTDFTEED